ncbi:unnamed protein product [Rhodiola kirilowii]
MWSKIQSWENLKLSYEGREVLIKFVLQAIPQYVMSCILLPESIIKKLYNVIYSYWWSGGMSSTIHWVRKALLVEQKIRGGLGFREIKDFNIALVTKQAWRLLTQPDFLWKSIFKCIDILHFCVVFDAGHDTWRWRFSSSGYFTVKSAYEPIRRLSSTNCYTAGGGSEGMNMDCFWSTYWKLKLPEKIKIFGWRYFYNSLPDGFNLS